MKIPIQNPKLALLALALPLALRSRWRSLALGDSVQNPKSVNVLVIIDRQLVLGFQIGMTRSYYHPYKPFPRTILRSILR
jgi:hypothetical protein